jgi:hypothetical protein
MTVVQSLASVVPASPEETEMPLPNRMQDDTDKGMKHQAESTDAARKKRSGEAAVQPQYHHDRRQELVPEVISSTRSCSTCTGRC